MAQTRKSGPGRSSLPTVQGGNDGYECHGWDGEGCLPSTLMVACVLDTYWRVNGHRAAIPAAGAVPLHPLRRAADGGGRLVQLLQLERVWSANRLRRMAQFRAPVRKPC